MNQQTASFLSGVIEGFYGPPWSEAERFELFDWMQAWGLNTYLYAPKDDLKHRVLWRETYATDEAAALGRLISACRDRGLHFIYALSPGLDIRHARQEDLDRLCERLAQMQQLGCAHFALLFDDIPDRLDAEDLRRWGTLASAQAQVANAAFERTRDRGTGGRFLFCPTPYCGRMAERKLGGEDYLETLGRELLPEIDIFWTGPEIVSNEISVEPVRELRGILRRKPVIWDNLHANDYDMRRCYCGPYSGRPRELLGEVNGVLSNPNVEFPLNYVPVRTLAEFVKGGGAWNVRKAYERAMGEWWSRFALVADSVALEDLVRFGDCYYLPHQEGEEGERLYELILRLLRSAPKDWREADVTAFLERSSRLRGFCARVTLLRDRRLFAALSRRVWELREELDLLEGYVRSRREAQGAGAAFKSDFHLPGTYRGGLVARLQRLLVQRADGGFAPRPPAELEHEP
jgi:protein O-GlcNAcase/histone acetyltransferase